MGKTLYLECNAGISGDMMVAALLDLGAEEKVLRQVLETMPVSGYEIQISRVKKAGVDCCDFHVMLDECHENHDHDMEYLHGHGHHHHEHIDETHHHHEHTDETHSHHHDHADETHHHHSHGEGHHHEHRGMAEIREILASCQMTENARKLAERIFEILAEAEAKAHAVPVEQVHFHEVGAVDSIIDIASVAVCMDNLDVSQVIIPKLCEGCGTVRCQHGILSVPVPAVANILAGYHLPVTFMDIPGEFITPTGAALVAAIKTSGQLPEPVYIDKIGLGAGKRSYERPSVLRAMLIRQGESAEDLIVKLESNIDDTSGEVLGYVLERLLEEGARDVHYMPVYMKKNRPAWQLNVLCEEKDVSKMEQIIFEETTTIGIRRQKMERTVLKRENQTVQTEYGEAQLKLCSYGDQQFCYPEYESVAKIAREQGLPFAVIYEMVKHAAR